MKGQTEGSLERDIFISFIYLFLFGLLIFVFELFCLIILCLYGDSKVLHFFSLSIIIYGHILFRQTDI